MIGIIKRIIEKLITNRDDVDSKSSIYPDIVKDYLPWPDYERLLKIVTEEEHKRINEDLGQHQYLKKKCHWEEPLESISRGLTVVAKTYLPEYLKEKRLDVLLEELR